MSQYVFGTGQLYATPVGGGAPLRFGALQDINIDISGDNKQLYGQYQFSLDVARGKTKIEGKASVGDINVEFYNTLFFGNTIATGQKAQAINEVATIPAMTTYTVTAANGATFVMDLGVYYAMTGLPLKQVPSAPTMGEYTVSSVGVYTFAAGDASAEVLLNYIWTDTANGNTLPISNLLMGSTPTFQLIASQLYKGKTFTLVLYSCISDKLTLPLKMDDHLISELTFQAQANSANQIGYMSTTG